MKSFYKIYFILLSICISSLFVSCATTGSGEDLEEYFFTSEIVGEPFSSHFKVEELEEGATLIPVSYRSVSIII